MDQANTDPSIEGRVWECLRAVSDPEIPPLSVVDMGIVCGVYTENESVVVSMTPTFAGCPALDTIRSSIAAAVRAAGIERVRVDVVFDPPWTSDRITPDGLHKLKEFGLAPPSHCGSTGPTIEALQQVACPFCGSRQTALESIFGPTLCRAIHYCNACRQSFEQFKPV